MCVWGGGGGGGGGALCALCRITLTLNTPEELDLYGFCVYYVVHICDFGTV